MRTARKSLSISISNRVTISCGWLRATPTTSIYPRSILRLQCQNRQTSNQEEHDMSRVRVLVGTRKGAFVLSADGKREKWEVSGPFFAGWEIYHLKGSCADPDRIYASQSSGWFGQVIQRSSDGGKTWDTPGGGVTT